MRWAFFVDATLEPTVSDLLEDEGYRAEYADYVLDEDADDENVADLEVYLRTLGRESPPEPSKTTDRSRSISRLDVAVDSVEAVRDVPERL